MKKIPVYKFYKHKYGDELLVDVISYEKMMPDIRRTLVFSETFYSITLVLEAVATVAGGLSTLAWHQENLPRNLRSWPSALLGSWFQRHEGHDAFVLFRIKS